MNFHTFSDLDLPYKSLGCLEGDDTESPDRVFSASCSLLDSDLLPDVQTIETCERCAKLKGHVYFSVRHRHQCFTYPDQGYESLATSHQCAADGRGGAHSGTIYERKCKQ